MTQLEPVRPVALNMSVFDGASLYDSLPRAAELGLEAVELTADVPQLFPALTSMGQVARLADLIADLDLRVVNLSGETGRGFFTPIPAGPVYEPSLIAPQGPARRLRLQHLLRCLDFAFALGAPCISVASGVCLPGMRPHQAWEQFQEGLAALLGHAEELGVLVAVAPRPHHLIARTEDLLALLEVLPHPLLGASLDLAQMAKEGEDVAAAALALSGRIWTVQATDARLPSPYRLAPGSGSVDLPRMLDALDFARYGGPLTLHLENECDRPDQAIHQALAALAPRVPA